jgi:uncharacterized membrane-anchored protein YhcB (DUF1043 family)
MKLTNKQVQEQITDMKKKLDELSAEISETTLQDARMLDKPIRTINDIYNDAWRLQKDLNEWQDEIEPDEY